MPLRTSDLIPDLTNFDNLSLAASIFLFYAGMEMSSVHIKDVQDPQHDYPKAIFIASGITVLLFILGTLALGFVIPQAQINLTQSLLVGYNDLFAYFNMPWMGQVMAFFLALGVFAGVSTWIGGPSKGLLAVGKAGYLPRWFQHTNEHGIQVHILFVQALIVTVLATLFVLLPSVQAAYQILSAMTVGLYLVMYIVMFSAFLKLRISQPQVKRTFVAPWGYFFGALGLVGSVVAFVLSFFPPDQINTGSPMAWVLILIIGVSIGVLAPFAIYSLRKPEWKDAATDFEPFSYEK